MKEKISFRFYILLAVIFIFSVVGINYIYFIGKDYNERGTFGDMFGGVNALFTGLSFIGLIVTILLQRRDMNLQRSAMNTQAFENTFFNLINRHHEIVLNFEKTITRRNNKAGKITETTFIKKGTDVFQTIYSSLVMVMKHNGGFTQEGFKILYKSNWDILGHYFRSLELILSIIDKSEVITYDDKCKYIDILKAQLSEYETALLFYNILSKNDPTFKELAERYVLFEFINAELVEDDVLLYKRGAKFK